MATLSLKSAITDKVVAHLRDLPEVVSKAMGSVDRVNAILGRMNDLARDVAQASWTLRHDNEDRDDLMAEDESELVFQVLRNPWSKGYPELPDQIESVLRDAFDDEHLKLEDPLGHAELNADLPLGEGGSP